MKTKAKQLFPTSEGIPENKSLNSTRHYTPIATTLPAHGLRNYKLYIYYVGSEDRWRMSLEVGRVEAESPN